MSGYWILLRPLIYLYNVAFLIPAYEVEVDVTRQGVHPPIVPDDYTLIKKPALVVVHLAGTCSLDAGTIGRRGKN
jgi:hypothetical protein